MDTSILSIFGNMPDEINLFPDTVVEEVIQNIRIILTTVVGTVPLDRRFGINAEFIDDPSPRAMMKLSIYILESIQEYEPRVEVMEIDFAPLPDEVMDGKMYPRVKVRLLDEYIV